MRSLKSFLAFGLVGFLSLSLVGLGSVPLVSAQESDTPDTSEWFPIMMTFALTSGMGFIGFNLARSRDPIPGIFMIFVGITLSWSFGWIETWIFIIALALVAITSAALWSKLFKEAK